MFLVPEQVHCIVWSREEFTQLDMLRLYSSFIQGGVAGVQAGLLSMSGHSCTTYLWTVHP